MPGQRREYQRCDGDESRQIGQDEHRGCAVDSAENSRAIPQTDQPDAHDRARDSKEDNEENVYDRGDALARSCTRIAEAGGDNRDDRRPDCREDQTVRNRLAGAGKGRAWIERSTLHGHTDEQHNGDDDHHGDRDRASRRQWSNSAGWRPVSRRADTMRSPSNCAATAPTAALNTNSGTASTIAREKS